MANIEIPEPVIKAEVNYYDTTDDEWVIDINVGTGYNAVTVMSHKVSRHWTETEDQVHDKYAYEVEEAMSYALEAFGERLKEVLAR